MYFCCKIHEIGKNIHIVWLYDFKTRTYPFGFEFKDTDAPGRTRSMHVAIEDLGLEHLWVIYPGDQKYTLDSKITAIPLEYIYQLADFYF